MSFDVVIRGGTVVDGSGLGAYRADVGIQGDRIAALGRIVERGKEEVDAEGHVVTPGFIDGHTHCDPALWWDPSCDPLPSHRVTTVVTGNCSTGERAISQTVRVIFSAESNCETMSAFSASPPL